MIPFEFHYLHLFKVYEVHAYSSFFVPGSSGKFP